MDTQNNNQDEINLKDLNDFKFIFLILFLLSIVAYGFIAFNLTLSGDDWRLIYDPLDHVEWFLSIGRWGNVLLWFLFHNDVFAPALTLFLSCGLIIFSGYTACKLFSLRNKFDCLLFISLFLFSPILAEPFNYKHYHIGIGVSVFLAVLSLYFIKRVFEEKTSLKSILLSKYLIYAVLLLTFSFGIFQGAALLFLCAAFAFLLFRLLKLKQIQTVLRGVFIILSVGLFSVFLSLGITKIIQILCKISPTEEIYYEFSLVSSFSDIVFTVNRFFSHFHQFLFRDQHLWPLSIKIIFLVFLGIFVASFLYQLKISKFHSKKHIKLNILRALFFLLLLCCFFISPWLLGLIRMPENSYRYNALLGLIIIYPFIIIMTIKLIKNVKIRFVLKILAVYIVISFMLFQNVASLATYTTNLRDLHLASNILSKVEILNERHDFKRLYIFGNINDKTKYPFKYSVMGKLAPMGTSAVEWGVLNNQIFRLEHLMGLISYRDKNDFIGVNFNSITWKLLLQATQNKDENKKKLLEECKKSEIWPSKRSIVFIDENVIVFLDKKSINRTIQLLERMLK